MDAEIITLKHVSECINKAFIADVFFTMNRQKNSPMPEYGNIFVAKNRLGPDGIKYPMLIDTSRSKIQLLAQDIDQEGESEEDKITKLRNRYKDFQKKNEKKNRDQAN
jgi:hypothetical protein